MQQPTQEPLHGTKLKINRAKTHFDELDGICRAFVERNPYVLIPEEDRNAGKLLFKVRIRECMPHEVSAVIGDVIHNLRAALDLLATELAVKSGASGKSSYFPFDADPAKFKTKWLRERTRIKDKRALQFFRRLKPYPGGNKALWALHQLDILDKHQAIIPVGAANVGLNPDMGADIPSEWRAATQIREFLMRNPIFLRPADRQYPLKDGAVLYSCPIPKPGEPQPKPQAAFGIAFGEGQIVDGEPVGETLQQYIKLAERITAIAERHFFRP